MLRAERKRARKRLAAREEQGSDVHGHSLKKKDQQIKNKNDGWAQPEKNKIKHINNKKDGHTLRAFLRQIWAAGVLSGTMITKLAFYISNAGGRGVSDFAVDPTVPKTNKARTVERAFHLKLIEDNLLLQVPLPLRSKSRTGTKTVLQDTFSHKK